MNTPAHALVNLALLTGGRRRAQTGPVLAGALLPDLPMFGFYLWQRLAVGAPEAHIWSVAYFESAWQNFFDVFNSLPLALAGLALGLWLRREALTAFCASVALHVLLDLPLHREDAHRHFLPFSDWRFESSVSYWDPAHYGAWGAFGEAAAVLAASVVLWRRFPRRAVRTVLASLSAVYVLGWSILYGAGQLQTSSSIEVSPGTPTRSGNP